MTIYILNGLQVDSNLPQTLEGNQYPPNWFDDADHRDALDLEPLHDTAPPTVTSTQKLTVNGYVRDAEERWVANWVITNLTSEELAQQAADLQAGIAAAIAATYRDVDAVYVDAIGQRKPEYDDAEADARAFAAAGYAGEPTAYVSGFALKNPTGQAQSNQWAADNIIARADAFQSAKLAMRNTRFDLQADMRAASTAAELATASAAWNGFIAYLRAQLGL